MQILSTMTINLQEKSGKPPTSMSFKPSSLHRRPVSTMCSPSCRIISLHLRWRPDYSRTGQRKKISTPTDDRQSRSSQVLYSSVRSTEEECGSAASVLALRRRTTSRQINPRRAARARKGRSSARTIPVR